MSTTGTPPSIRSAYARLAALHRAAQYDGRELTAKARAAAAARFEREIRERYPDLTDEREIERRANALKRAAAVKAAITRWHGSQAVKELPEAEDG